ncbi:DNA protecting protein DprA [Catenovulum agarivorans DS-2]|uniref:DNA protecting protein DprA n=1 Tax=Catenovulum agarivorans DS-2 TaxID=1328313 RepID=W7QSS9_9ALTE|nr:DNA-processing protein DprA [Catenovulum agarivorans]EWH10933.1 DNA protecting protein DprA [Catenovulum agarivorans DS-2]
MDDNTCAWLRIKQLGLRGRKWMQQLAFRPLHKVLQDPEHKLIQYGFKPEHLTELNAQTEQSIEQELNWCRQSTNHHIIHWQHPAYPEQLKQIASAPLVLYAIGDIDLLQQTQVAMVGSRHASHYGADNAFAFAKDLAARGIIVTSGFASGIDGQAHKGALAANGKTIAVFGTGVDVIYPKRHQSLYQQIAQTGLILSEFPPGTPPRPKHFPRRNRLISGLSLGVLVVEAAPKSGSLITANYALEQGREVFAIPGSIHDPRTQGCHQIIQQGAKLVTQTADILEELSAWHWQQQPVEIEKNLEKTQKSDKENFTSHELLVNLDYEVTSIDELVARTQQSIEVVLSQLLDLEIQGLIAATSGGYIRLRRE